ncbi:MAG: hypothetical protein J3K34DRAFT_453224 [Monoraphidium minutum]|nr:MAG: hypothetical protein J3K34DRAFT_453224 [Monoraphidium minutum]
MLRKAETPASTSMLRAPALRLLRSMGHRAVAARAASSVQVPAKRSLEDLAFDNTFVRELPADPEASNSLRQVFGALYSRVSPTPAAGEPRLVAYSREVAELLDLDSTECERPEFALLMAGAAPLPGSEPYAQCYGGHQFGQWAGQLGDGRAITLGEASLRGRVVNARGGRWELQLKGAGRTPYSRRADGRAVLRSSLREYVCSEAMAALGVPTTRALSLVTTGDKVMRDMFYNGDVKFEPGAVVCRVAPSFVRFGTFQLPVSRGPEETGLTRSAADYVIRHHYPEIAAAHEGPSKYLAWLREVSLRTARLAAAWQGVGFVHGVLNTDNMSILGLTIDYGPFGFLDKFDPYWSPNLTDIQSGRRYCYRNQPEMAQWNCAQLANALLAAELVGKEEAEEVLREYAEVLLQEYNRRMAAKMGLQSYDKALAMELLKLMFESEADFTNTFRALASIPASDAAPASDTPPGARGLPAALAAAIPEEQLTEEEAASWHAWLGAWRARLREEGVADEERWAAMKRASPKFVPRQHLLQYAIDAAEGGDFSELEALLEVLAAPYDDQPGADAKYSSPPPAELADKPGVCMLSCSS